VVFHTPSDGAVVVRRESLPPFGERNSRTQKMRVVCCAGSCSIKTHTYIHPRGRQHEKTTMREELNANHPPGFFFSRALALASSILGKKARVEGQATLNSIVERDTGGSREKKAIEPVDWFSGCVVEEYPSIGDLICMEKSSNRETLSRQNINSAPTMVDDLPGCVVEEIPWLIDQQTTDTLCNWRS
jgi:hypothetical protein